MTRKDPSMTEQPKKSTYYPDAQRRYDQKRAASSFCVGFRFVRGQDDDIIRYLEQCPSRQAAVRQALREMIARQKVDADQA